MALTSCEIEPCSDSPYTRSECRAGDKFRAETLIGNWTCLTTVGAMEIKSITFFDDHKCDVTYSQVRGVDWFTDTYSYTYTSGYIRLSRGRTSIQFKVSGFLFPELYVSDSFGTYAWKYNG